MRFRRKAKLAMTAALLAGLGGIALAEAAGSYYIFTPKMHNIDGKEYCSFMLTPTETDEGYTEIDTLYVAYDRNGNLTSLNSNGSNDSFGGSVALGRDAEASGFYSTVTGADSAITRDDEKAQKYMGIKTIQGTASTIYGAMNTVDTTDGAVYSGVATHIDGTGNTVKASNGVTISGTGNTVTEAYQDMNMDLSDAIKISQGKFDEIDWSKKKSGAVAVIGGGNTISKTVSTTAIGYANTVSGSENVFTAGTGNVLTDVKNSVVMGNGVTMSEVENVVSLGNGNKVTAGNAVALGDGAGVSAAGGVALGVGSNASVKEGAVGYLADGAADAAWVSTAAAVSVGDVGNGKTRQVTSVAAGTKDTDAVNVAQLKKVNGQVIQNTQNITNLYGEVRRLDSRLDRVGAGTAALAALHPLDFDPDAKWDFAAGYGNYRGADALAAGVFYRPNEDVLLSLSGSAGGGEHMVNAGLSLKIGAGSSHVNTSKVAMAKEVKELREKVSRLTALVESLMEEKETKTALQDEKERFRVDVIHEAEEGRPAVERVRAVSPEEAP